MWRENNQNAGTDGKGLAETPWALYEMVWRLLIKSRWGFSGIYNT